MDDGINKTCALHNTLGAIARYATFLAAFISLIFALTTVSYQAVKAALANPVEALRYK
ncbi:MAG: hypothetical protein ONB46_23325 [candidate division KSB1 bacterium]|nr:hypothetical protein [candidate division KSB1 bacterium]MDZ7368771.1 hypothetical protein [candidate division KSB1 bacterium]MDZ7406581.1 hypothetical protein [candidate division KSB1 bacterium]